MSSSATNTLPAIQIGPDGRSVTLDGAQPVFILGPCVIESEDSVWELARSLHEIATTSGFRFIFKASYDKANRTSIESFRGPGLEAGCKILGEIGKELNVPVTTDVHSPRDAEVAAEFVDLVQIPAFLCRQTDLIVAAAGCGVPVNVKKGQFLAPSDIRPIAGKLSSAGCDDFFFTERGSSFGYNNLVADMRSLAWMREQGHRVIFDATHSVQRPGGAGDSSSGDGALAPVLARAAVAAGCDGVFIETHPDPSQAKSDGPNQIPLKDLPPVLHTLTAIHQAAHGSAVPA